MDGSCCHPLSIPAAKSLVGYFWTYIDIRLIAIELYADEQLCIPRILARLITRVATDPCALSVIHAPPYRNPSGPNTSLSARLDGA